MQLKHSRGPIRLQMVSLVLLVCWSGLGSASWSSTFFRQAALGYQDRGDRFEGVKGLPVSDRAELLAALINTQEQTGQLPPQFKLNFYLQETAKVYVRVREIDNRRNYWLDNLKPSRGWQTGFNNEFQWPTQAVISGLQVIKLQDLGAVAQLGSNDPSLDMRVAPIALYATRPPQKVASYSFTFMISRKANVTYSFSKDVDKSEAIESHSFDMPGHRPRAITWNPSNAAEGWYRLTLAVTYSNNGHPVNQLVHFYHRPRIG